MNAPSPPARSFAGLTLEQACERARSLVPVLRERAAKQELVRRRAPHKADASCEQRVPLRGFNRESVHQHRVGAQRAEFLQSSEFRRRVRVYTFGGVDDEGVAVMAIPEVAWPPRWCRQRRRCAPRVQVETRCG